MDSYKRTLIALQFQRSMLCSVLADMCTKGMKLDAMLVSTLYKDSVEKRNELAEKLYTLTGGVNLSSNKQLAEYLYDVLGFEVVEKTAKGAPSTSIGTINELVPKNEKQKEFLELYSSFNKVDQLLTKYLTLFNAIVEENDGLLFGDINQGTTSTHRFSSSGVPFKSDAFKKERSVQFQNIPRELKKVFVPKRVGWSIGEVDGCFTYGHKILMSDLSLKEVQDIKVGDELVGIDEEVCNRSGSYRGLDRKMRRSVVEATKTLTKPCYRLYLSDGTHVEVSSEHPFLCRDKHRASFRWETAEWIHKTRKKVSIRKLVDVHDSSLVTAREARLWGKLAAYIDSDGSVSHDKVQLTQQDGSDVLVDMENVLLELGLPYAKTNFRMSKLSTKPVCSLTVTGMRNLLRIKQLADPVKLRRNHYLLWENKCPKGCNVAVVGSEYVGYKDVYSIQTSTKTYVSEGLFSHNCQLEFRVAAALAQDPVAIKEIHDMVDIHSCTAEFFGCSRQDAKKFSFGPLYGGNGSTKKERDYAKFFRKKYAAIAKMQNGWCNEVVSSPERKLVLPYGMVYNFPNSHLQADGYISGSTNIYNFGVQGLATAEIIPVSLAYMWHNLPDGIEIVNTIHDSIICEVRNDMHDAWLKLCIQSMTFAVYDFFERVYGYPINVPLGLGAKLGERWGAGDERTFQVENGSVVEIVKVNGKKEKIPWNG